MPYFDTIFINLRIMTVSKYILYMYLFSPIHLNRFVDNFAHEQGGALVFSDHTTSSHIKRCHFKGVIAMLSVDC
jgi:hypothetical protein